MSAIFISHSSRDNPATIEVRDKLAEQGHRSIFLDFDPADGIPAGRNWEKELYTRLRGCRAVIVLCSENSMASDWCFAEITHAKSLGKPIFPIKVAPCSLRSVLTDLQVLDLSGDREEAYRRLERGLLVAGLDPRNFFDWDGSRPPYPGLLAFQQADAAIFFGREAETQQGLDLANRLQRFGGARMAIVLGASGSGKSSLLRAGLMPRLKRDTDRWLIVDAFRPLQNPVRELALVISDAFERYGSPRDWKEIRDLLDAAATRPQPDGRELIELTEELRIAAGRREASVVLAIDQVEELLGYAEEDRAAGFLPMLRGALEAADSPLMVLGTLRSDFLGDFQNHTALRELAFESRTVGPLTADGFAQVIEGPAAVAGLELEAGLVQAMIDDTQTHNALPLLAFTLRELYERHGAEGKLAVKQYRELGGLEGSVARAAEGVLAAKPLAGEEQEDLRDAFVSMVRINDEGQYARRPARWDEVPQRSHSLLERFVAARLLVSRSDDRGRIVEVAHESLFRAWEQLKSWLDEDCDSIRLRDGIRKAAAEWNAAGRDAPFLVHRGARLEAAETLARQPRFEVDAAAREYIQACVDLRQAELDAKQEQERREREALERLAAEQMQRAEEQARSASKLKKWFMAATAVGLVAVAASIVALWQRSKAETARLHAVAQRNVADARLDIAKQAVSSMLTEVGAEALKNVPQMESVRAALLEKALRLYEEIGKTSDAEDEATRFETAVANFQVGEIRRLLGVGEDPKIAEAAYKEAISQLGKLSRQFPTDSRYKQALARSHMWLGELLREFAARDRADEAEQHYDAAIQLQSELVEQATDANRSQYQIDLGRSRMNRGILRKNGMKFGQSKDDYDAAEQLFAQVLRHDGLSPAQEEESRVLLAKCHLNRGVLLGKLYQAEADPQHLENAKTAYNKAIDELNAVQTGNRRQNQPQRLEYSLDQSKYRNNLAIAWLTGLDQLNDAEKQTRLNEAEEQIAEAVQLGEGLNVGTREVRVELARFYNTKAFILSRKQPGLAIGEWKKAANVLETVRNQNKQDDEATKMLGMVQCNICEQYQKQGEHEEALAAIGRLGNLSCTKSRYERAAELVQQGRGMVRDPALADQYKALHDLFRTKAQNAK